MYHLEGFQRLLVGLAESDLGDARLNRRAQRMAHGMRRAPSASITVQMGDRHQAKRAYAFLSNPMIDPDALSHGPLMEVARAVAIRPRVLLVGDDSLFDLTSHSATRGIGPVGDHHYARGLQFHGLLAVDGSDRRVLGLADLQIWARPDDRPSISTSKESTYARATRPRESQVWGHGIERAADRIEQACSRASCDLRPRLISIGDRGADIDEHLRRCVQLGIGFIVRAYQDRALCDADGSKREEHLHEMLKQAVPRGELITMVRSKAGGQRKAIIDIATLQVRLRAPQTLRRGKPLDVNVVCCTERTPPPGEKPAKWILHTSEPIDTAEQVLTVIEDYKCRWLIEEWHMALKTGCAVEERQLESRHGMENFVALAGHVAVCLLQLRDEERREDPRLARRVLAPSEWIALKALRPRLKEDASAHEALREIARVGGHAGSNQTKPGWRTLWIGMERLSLVAIGVAAAQQSSLIPGS